MITNNEELFEEFEIELDCTTYYANGYVEYSTTECVGTNYEGYDYERYYEREVDVTIGELWYYDRESGNSVSILGNSKFREIEELAEEEIRYHYE